MNINIKDILTLSDDNRYVVISKTQYENKEYLYLIDINDNKNMKFCYINGNKIIESNSKELNTKLIPLFYEVSKDMLSMQDK